MASVIGTAVARAPRTSRTKSLQATLNKGMHMRSQYNTGEVGPTIFNNALEVISFLDVFVDHVQSTSGDKDIQSAIATLCINLKAYGPQLEVSFKDQLDQAFNCLRNASQDEKLDKLSRLHLLEVIELRASRWNSQDSDSVIYYQRKVAEVEECKGTDVEPVNILATNSSQSLAASGLQQSGATSPQSTTPPPMLLPGEVIKSSGKYSSHGGPVKIPGKNFFKEEVIIRNADSGKVSPGAKERLVQITGAAEDKIERARQLMEETIIRNASPTRNKELSTVSGDSGSVTSVDAIQCFTDASEISKVGEPKSRRQSMTEAALNEYRYSVNVGDQVISITGQNLDLIRVSKLVLDEYFSAMTEGDRLHASSNSSFEDNSMDTNDSRQGTIVPGNSTTSVVAKHSYKREYLILWSSSPLCKQPPPNFENVILALPEIVRKECQAFNGAAFLDSYPVCQLATEQPSLFESMNDE